MLDNSYVVLTLDPDTFEVDVGELGDLSKTAQDLIGVLPSSQCRFVIFLGF